MITNMEKTLGVRTGVMEQHYTDFHFKAKRADFQ